MVDPGDEVVIFDPYFVMYRNLVALAGGTTVLVDTYPDHDPELRAEAGFERDRVVQALHELPPRLRAVIVLRDVYDLPHESIAAELGITEAAAKVRLHRARRKLRECLFPSRSEDTLDEEGDARAV